MREPAKQQPITRRSGFAIIVVLASLLILTTLFAIASQRSMAHVQTQSAERQLAKDQAENAAIIAVLTDLGTAAVVSTTLTLPEPFSDTTLRLQDVGGLIDLNTASPELLGALFVSLDFPADAASRFRQWRREGRRLVRIDDLIRITNADPAILDDLSQVATVFSGRRGIAPAIAPTEVLAIGRRTGSQPNTYTTPPSNTNFAVYNDEQLISTISIPSASNRARVLELR